MKKSFTFLFVILLIIGGCSSAKKLQKFGKRYQKHQDYESLARVVELIELDSDTAYVKKILGEPIDMGFDYRYLVDSIGEKGCVIGAVFHINEYGKIDQKWIDEICE